MRGNAVRRLKNRVQRPRSRRKGSVFVEYILLVTIVGIGVIVGLACLREALVNELLDLANAINAINC
jgi:Flp pilus assembly pilin Flp